MRQRWPDVVWGLRFGWAFAGLFSAYAIFQRVAFGPHVFDRYHMTITGIVAIYAAGGTFSGGLVGFCRPLTRYTLGAATIGFFAMAPVSAVIVRTLEDSGAWTYIDTIVVVFCSVALGTLPALIWLDQKRRSESHEKHDDV